MPFKTKPVFAEPWRLAFVEHKADPTDDRTTRQFCAEMDISHGTLYDWWNKYRSEINRKIEIARNVYVSEIRSRAWKALNKKLSKDTNAIKLAFQLTGDLVERTHAVHEHLTPDEKRRKIEALLEKIVPKSKEEPKS